MPRKNVLALLTGLVAVALAVLAALWDGQPLAILGSSVAAVVAILWGVKSPPRRTALVLMTTAAGSAALFVHFDSFWGLFVAVFVFVWAAFGLLPVMDGAWRLKAGFVASVFLGAFVVLWPTLDSALPTANTPVPDQPAWLGALARAGRSVASRVHCPAYLKDRITFGIAPGLDLSGGLRLVYTVEVEEAIRDKRDHFADEMRQELATALRLPLGRGARHARGAREARREGARRSSRRPRSSGSSSRTRPTRQSSTSASPRSFWASSR